MFEKILLFVRDWLPSIAIIIGGVWALWVFKFKEKLRRKKEMPAISGRMRISILDASETHSVALIKSTWKNHSPLPVPLDTDRIFVQVYPMNLQVEPGFMNIPDDLDEAIHSGYPFSGYSEFVLEPDSTSSLNAYVALENGYMYLLRWTITQKKADSYFWDSEKLVDLRPSVEES